MFVTLLNAHLTIQFSLSVLKIIDTGHPSARRSRRDGRNQAPADPPPAGRARPDRGGRNRTQGPPAACAADGTRGRADDRDAGHEPDRPAGCRACAPAAAQPANNPAPADRRARPRGPGHLLRGHRVRAQAAQGPAGASPGAADQRQPGHRWQEAPDGRWEILTRSIGGHHFCRRMVELFRARRSFDASTGTAGFAGVFAAGC